MGRAVDIMFAERVPLLILISSQYVLQDSVPDIWYPRITVVHAIDEFFHFICCRSPVKVPAAEIYWPYVENLDAWKVRKEGAHREPPMK
eukprot:1190830-Prorocentrum_minimum.AAC.2